MKDGKLIVTEQWFGYLRPQASHLVITNLSQPGHGHGLCQSPFYRLHHSFAAYPGPHHFNVWVNPAATQEREMLRIDLACVLRLSGCKDVADMVPMAWGRYQSDQRIIDSGERKGQSEIAAYPECR